MSDERVEAIRAQLEKVGTADDPGWPGWGDVHYLLDRLEAAERERDALDRNWRALEAKHWEKAQRLERATELLRAVVGAREALPDVPVPLDAIRAFLTEGTDSDAD